MNGYFMPHLQIQYSKTLDQKSDIAALCQKMAAAIGGVGLYPLGGIRVRALACDHAVIADGHADNEFCDMVFRIGKGRSAQDKAVTGDALMKAAQDHFEDLLQSPHFMLSLEIVDIAEASWKVNPVHTRLQKER